MPRKLRGVAIVHDRHGKPRWRMRRTIKGKRIDVYLPGPYGGADFVAAYEAALEGARGTKQRAKAGTIAQLVETYKGSTKFRDLKPRTKNVKLRRLDRIVAVIGEAQYARMKPHHVEALMAKAKGPTAANQIKKDLSQLFDVAVKNFSFSGLNPAKMADSFKVDSDGFYTWTDVEIDTYRATHASGTTARLALELLLGTGAARQDAAAMTRANVRGGEIVYRRGKTGTEVSLPLEVLPELSHELSRMPADRLVLIPTPHGRAYTPEGLSRAFKRWCADAGLSEKCTPHGLRKAAARRLVEAGATEHEIMSNLGHETPAMAALYTRAANRGKMAAAGRAKLRAVS